MEAMTAAHGNGRKPTRQEGERRDGRDSDYETAVAKLEIAAMHAKHVAEVGPTAETRDDARRILGQLRTALADLRETLATRRNRRTGFRFLRTFAPGDVINFMYPALYEAVKAAQQRQPAPISDSCYRFQGPGAQIVELIHLSRWDQAIVCDSGMLYQYEATGPEDALDHHIQRMFDQGQGT